MLEIMIVLACPHVLWEKLEEVTEERNRLVLDVIFADENLPSIFAEFFSVSTNFPHPFARRLCDSPRLLVSKINLKVLNGFY